MRRRSLTNQFFQQGERQLIRLIILGSVILVVIQFSLVRDPVQFYLAMAQKVESPILEINSFGQVMTPASSQSPTSTSPVSSSQTGVWQITLKATPKSAVHVLQNGKDLGALTEGEQVIAVQTGIIQLDATKVKQPVRVQVLKCDPLLSQPHLNQVFVCNQSVQEIWVGP